jgi:hypothetical protein
MLYAYILVFIEIGANLESEVVWLIRARTQKNMHLLRKFLLYKMLMLFKYPYFVNCYCVLVKMHARNLMVLGSYPAIQRIVQPGNGGGGVESGIN